LTSSELEDACIHGVCYELHWLDEQGIRNFYSIPIDQGIPIYDNGIRPKVTAFVWFRTVDEVEMATVYTESTYQEWANVKGWEPVQEELPHGYGQVPVNIGMIDRDGRNLFDHVIPILDAIDKLASADVMNEADRYSSALLAMAERLDTTATDELGRTMVDRLKELRLIDGLGDGDVRGKIAFITKDLPVDFIRFAIEFLERMARESLQIPNMMDPKFGESSGIAKAFQLLPLEYMATRIESHFARFLYNRMYMIAGIGNALMEDNTGVREVQITFDRNLPYNLVELADVVIKLKGIVSDETLLKLFPTQVIPDVEAELEALAEVRPSLLDETESEATNGAI
jgi:SPP1 family phage portal protein